jgi:hypothetical protein
MRLFFFIRKCSKTDYGRRNWLGVGIYAGPGWTNNMMEQNGAHP